MTRKRQDFLSSVLDRAWSLFEVFPKLKRVLFLTLFYRKEFSDQLLSNPWFIRLLAPRVIWHAFRVITVWDIRESGEFSKKISCKTFYTIEN